MTPFFCDIIPLVLPTTHTGISIDFERYITAPEIWWVLTVGVDPRGYFLGGFNLFRLANKKLFGFFVCII